MTETNRALSHRPPTRRLRGRLRWPAYSASNAVHGEGVREPSVASATQPFVALVSVLSLLIGLLYVAGFSCRWSYFYNFGMHHIVYETSIQFILVTAIELIRTPSNAAELLVRVAIPMLALTGALRILLTKRIQNTTFGVSFASVLGLRSALVVDSIRAAILVYTVYGFGQDVGYRLYKAHVIESPSNPLPAVTLLFDTTSASIPESLKCGASEPTVLIGDATRVAHIQDDHLTCTRPGSSWRLLYRDDKMLYAFATIPPGRISRPLTIALPSSQKIAVLAE